MPQQIYLGLILFLLLSGTVSAATYKCVGPGGGVVFSDRPCEGKQEVMDLKYRHKLPEKPASSSETEPTLAEKPPPLTSVDKGRQAPTEPTTPKKSKSEAPVVPLEDRLAALCVDAYRPHLAYKGVKIRSHNLEKRLNEWIMTVNVRTITNNATPLSLGITLDEKFICVTDGHEGLNARSTGMWVERHKRGLRL